MSPAVSTIMTRGLALLLPLLVEHSDDPAKPDWWRNEDETLNFELNFVMTHDPQTLPAKLKS